jgi:hypothetical protein
MNCLFSCEMIHSMTSIHWTAMDCNGLQWVICGLTGTIFYAFSLVLYSTHTQKCQFGCAFKIQDDLVYGEYTAGFTYVRKSALPCEVPVDLRSLFRVPRSQHTSFPNLATEEAQIVRIRLEHESSTTRFHP